MAPEAKPGILVAAMVGCIRLYQRATRWLPPVCRFHPTCSHYAIEALAVHGPWRGLRLAVWRILRCNPLCQGGLDPVPPRVGGAPPSDVHPTGTDNSAL